MLQDVADGCGHGTPAALFDVELPATGGGDLILRARRLRSVTTHRALIQPASSIRCSAGYSEPSSTRSDVGQAFDVLA